MRVLKLSVLILLALLVLVVGIGSFLPKDFTVERSIEMNTSPEVVFDEVSSLRKWDAWSPWLARDPSIVNTYSGPAAGVGAKVTWTSVKSGDGTQMITFSHRPKRLETALDFGEMGQPRAYWTFEPSGEGVEVTWGLTGTTSGLLGGYFAKMMDHRVGADYQDGLARLKEVVEAMPTGE
jgi:hypothetical protein